MSLLCERLLSWISLACTEQISFSFFIPSKIVFLFTLDLAIIIELCKSSSSFFFSFLHLICMVLLWILFYPWLNTSLHLHPHQNNKLVIDLWFQLHIFGFYLTFIFCLQFLYCPCWHVVHMCILVLGLIQGCWIQWVIWGEVYLENTSIQRLPTPLHKVHLEGSMVKWNSHENGDSGNLS